MSLLRVGRSKRQGFLAMSWSDWQTVELAAYLCFLLCITATREKGGRRLDETSAMQRDCEAATRVSHVTPPTFETLCGDHATF